MKVALISDLHANREALEAIFSHIRASGVQKSIGIGGRTQHAGMHDEDLRFHGLEGREHMTLALPEGKKCFLNVGSTGQPRDGDPRACYAVLEDHQITWHRVAYDYRATMQKIMDTGVLSEVLARRLAVGK